MDRYPLAWPQGWKRTDASMRTGAKFKKASRWESGAVGQGQRYIPGRGLSMYEATNRTLAELRRMGVEQGDAIISTNVELRLDGTPRSDRRAPLDPGAAVYWIDRAANDVRRCMAVDHYDRVEDNLAAIAATLEAMRAIERHGGAQILARAFTGFDALPAPGQTSGRGWRQILGFTVDASPTRTIVEQAYRRRRSETHPDKPGGDADEFGAVQRAWEIAQQELPA